LKWSGRCRRPRSGGIKPLELQHVSPSCEALECPNRYVGVPHLDRRQCCSRLMADVFGATAPSTGFAFGNGAEEESEDQEAWVRGISNLRDHISTRNNGSQRTLTELEASRGRIRDAYQVQMILLKELELQRIDLQMAVHRLVSMRQNWKVQYVEHRRSTGRSLTVNPEVEQRLFEEELAAMSEVQATDASIALVVAQVTKLRDIREAIDRRLSEKRQHLHLESQIIDQCKELMKRPNTTKAASRRNPSTARDQLYTQGAGAASHAGPYRTFLPDSGPMSAR